MLLLDGQKSTDLKRNAFGVVFFPFFEEQFCSASKFILFFCDNYSLLDTVRGHSNCIYTASQDVKLSLILHPFGIVV